jgi:hypothetical protein
VAQPTRSKEPTPTLPRDSRAQQIGRHGESVVSERFEGHGWIVATNRPRTDFGVDLSAFRRASDRSVLPYALSVQAKTVNRATSSLAGGVSVRVKASTLASWLWSNTPTICVVYEEPTGRMWWTVPVPGRGSHSRAALTRTLWVGERLTDESEWSGLADTVCDLWNHHEGAGSLMDVALVLQVLTDVALETDLWSAAGGTSGAIYHAAAVHTYRTVAGLNALAGRIGSTEFLALADIADEQVGVCRSQGLVRREGVDLGVLSSIELRPWSTYLLDIFGQCGRQLAAAVPRLRQLAHLPELGIPADVAYMLRGITDLQLAIVDPDKAADLSEADFAQLADRDETCPLDPEIDNQVLRMVARSSLTAHPPPGS